MNLLDDFIGLYDVIRHQIYFQEWKLSNYRHLDYLSCNLHSRLEEKHTDRLDG